MELGASTCSVLRGERLKREKREKRKKPGRCLLPELCSVFIEMFYMFIYIYIIYNIKKYSLFELLPILTVMYCEFNCEMCRDVHCAFGLLVS